MIKNITISFLIFVLSVKMLQGNESSSDRLAILTNAGVMLYGESRYGLSLQFYIINNGEKAVLLPLRSFRDEKWMYTEQDEVPEVSFVVKGIGSSNEFERALKLVEPCNGYLTVELRPGESVLLGSATFGYTSVEDLPIYVEVLYTVDRSISKYCDFWIGDVLETVDVSNFKESLRVLETGKGEEDREKAQMEPQEN